MSLCNEKQLARLMQNYIRERSYCYDPIFAKIIDDICPKIIRLKPMATKVFLLEMAKNGKEKPKSGSKLGNALTRYTAPSQGSTYDMEFTEAISKHWNINFRIIWTEDIAIQTLIDSKHKKHSDLRKEYPGMFEAVDRNNWLKFKEICKDRFPNKQKIDSEKSQKDLDEWIKINKRAPKGHVKNLTECRMSSLFKNRLRKDLEFIKRYPDIKYGRKTRYVKVKCIQTEQIFESVTSAVKSFGDYSTANLIRAIKKGTKYRGLHWEYYE